MKSFQSLAKFIVLAHSLLIARAEEPPSSGVTFCERVEKRIMAFEGQRGGSPFALAVRLVKENPGNETELLSSLGSDAISSSWEGDQEPYFRSQWLSDKTRRRQGGDSRRPLRVAVIISGQVRTMLEQDVRTGYRKIIQDLVNLKVQDTSEGSNVVKVFAYLDPIPGTTYRKSGEAHFVRQPWNPGYTIDRPSVEACLSSWGATSGFSLRFSGGVGEQFFPDAPAHCDMGGNVGAGSPQMHQFLKVGAAVAMMQHDEQAQGEKEGGQGWRYDVVVRLRPDFCPESVRRFVAVATAHAASAGAVVPFLIYDAAAVVPRWAAEALGSAWRTFGPRCRPDAPWEVRGIEACRDEGSEDEAAHQPATLWEALGERGGACLGGALETHFAALGAWSVDLHHFWQPRPDPRNSSNVGKGEPALRRPGGCAAFC